MTKQLITFIAKDKCSTWGGYTEVACALLSRDWKGWNTYGMNAVMELIYE